MPYIITESGDFLTTEDGSFIVTEDHVSDSSLVLPVKCLFISSIPVDASTLMTNSEVSTLPVSNLYYPEPSRVWRSASHTPRVVIQLSTPLACNAVSVTGHNAVSTTEFRVQGGLTLNSVTGISSPAVDTGLMSMWPPSGKIDLGLPYQNSLGMFSNDTEYTWWSVEFSDPDNLDMFEAARIMIDRAMRPRVNVSGEIGLQVSTADDQRINAFNYVFGDVRGPNTRKMSLPFKAINKEDFRESFFVYQMKHGRVKDFFFCANPSYDRDFALFSMQALFGDMAQFGRQLMYDGDGGMWAATLPLIEYS